MHIYINIYIYIYIYSVCKHQDTHLECMLVYTQEKTTPSLCRTDKSLPYDFYEIRKGIFLNKNIIQDIRLDYVAAGETHQPIGAPSTCLYILSLNIKILSFVHKSKSFLKVFFVITTIKKTLSVGNK